MAVLIDVVAVIAGLWLAASVVALLVLVRVCVTERGGWRPDDQPGEPTVVAMPAEDPVRIALESPATAA